jgi:hypothetical protein
VATRPDTGPGSRLADGASSLCGFRTTAPNREDSHSDGPTDYGDWRPVTGPRRTGLLALRPDGQTLRYVYPFSVGTTGHRVTLGRHTLNSMCAIDALGTGAMYGRDIAIDSQCGFCSEAIRVTTADKGNGLDTVSPAGAVVWYDFALTAVLPFRAARPSRSSARTSTLRSGWTRSGTGEEPVPRIPFSGLLNDRLAFTCQQAEERCPRALSLVRSLRFRFVTRFR